MFVDMPRPLMANGIFHTNSFIIFSSSSGESGIYELLAVTYDRLQAIESLYSCNKTPSLVSENLKPIVPICFMSRNFQMKLFIL